MCKSFARTQGGPGLYVKPFEKWLWNVREAADLVFGVQKGRGRVSRKLQEETGPKKMAWQDSVITGILLMDN